jgi:hypothetical protein
MPAPYPLEFRHEAVELLKHLRVGRAQARAHDGPVPGVRVCEDLVDRAFMASARDRLSTALVTLAGP